MSKSPPPLLKATNLHKSFYSPDKTEVLRGIDFEVEEGESVAILGRSGEGKSTLLSVLGTLETPTRGELSFRGAPVFSSSTREFRKNKLGFIFQSFHLLEDESVLDNVLMPAKIARKPVHILSPAYKRAEELLDKVGMSERKKYPIKKLSGGEKQRVALARAFLNDPELILADEPSGNLDRENAEIVHNLLLSFTKEHKKTLIVVTHDKWLAERCDRILILNQGILIPRDLDPFGS